MLKDQNTERRDPNYDINGGEVTNFTLSPSHCFSNDNINEPTMRYTPFSWTLKNHRNGTMGKNTPKSILLSSLDSGLRQLFEDQLKDIYWAEIALTQAIPVMLKQASSEELQDTLKTHLKETKEQVKRCEEIFRVIGAEPRAEECDPMKGLIEEANELIAEYEESSTKDAAIICVVQKIEHYEIATYGTLISYAETMGESKIVSILEETLGEEKNADIMLTDIAMNTIYQDISFEEG